MPSRFSARFPSVSPFLASALLALSACGEGSAHVDDFDDSASEVEAMLASYPGLTEGSRDALGVLKLANEASSAQLTQSAGVGVPARTAKSLLAVRDGSDGVHGTTDDRLFTTLSQLYAVRYVGTVTVTRLLTFARAHGYVTAPPPQDDPMPTCDGAPAPMPASGLILFTGGTRSTFFRNCAASGACTPWKKDRDEWLTQGTRSRSLSLTASGAVSVEAQVGGGSVSDGYYWAGYDIGWGQLDVATGVGAGEMSNWRICDISGGTGGPREQNGLRTVAIKHGATCLALTDRPTGPPDGVQVKRVILLHR